VLYEERRIVLRRGALPDFRAHVHGTLWPALAGAGARPLCLLSGLIGLPAEEAFLFTGFADADAWLASQRLFGGDPDRGGAASWSEERAASVVEERARLLVDSGVRPEAEISAADRRAVYGMRRFWIRPPDWPAFVQHSAEGIWPRIESQDARILGLFRDAAVTEPLECVLLTGYHGPAHWEETRGTSEAFARLPDDLRGNDTQARGGRNALTLRSYVCLMTAHWPRP
jgi:hypothetical protein